MKKIFVLSLLSLMILPGIVQANLGSTTDFDNMMNHKMTWAGGLGMMLFGLIYFAVFSFIFSLIFWLVYKRIIKK